MDENDALNELVGPPPEAGPALPGPGTWSEVEAELGSALPRDYQRMVGTYGSGCFDDFIWLLTPGTTNDNLNLGKQNEVRLAALRDVAGEGEDVPFDLSDDGGDLVAWAFTDNGDVLYWLRRPADMPDDWGVAVNEARGPHWEVFDLSATSFLVEVLSGRLSVGMFAEDFPSSEPQFIGAGAGQ